MVNQVRDNIWECPEANYMRGVSMDGDIRWTATGCKRRTCPVCGRKRKKKIAWRIAAGIEALGRGEGGGWVVGGFKKELDKKEMVKTLAKFIRRVRKESGVNVEYAVTWERYRKGGLHVNIIMVPWVFVDFKVLRKWWTRYGGQPRLSIKRVGAGIGAEAAKSMQKYGNYVAKFDQMVLKGKGVSYSKGWPKLPDLPPALDRKGDISWLYLDKYSPEAAIFRDERERGYWSQVGVGEFKFMLKEKSDAFDREVKLEE